MLKVLEMLENLKFMMGHINPRKFSIIINKTNIKLFLPTEVGAARHTSEKTRSKGAFETLVDLGYGSCLFFPFGKHHTPILYWTLARMAAYSH
jgi:hypothetical protein